MLALDNCRGAVQAGIPEIYPLIPACLEYLEAASPLGLEEIARQGLEVDRRQSGEVVHAPFAPGLKTSNPGDATYHRPCKSPVMASIGATR